MVKVRDSNGDDTFDSAGSRGRQVDILALSAINKDHLEID